MRNIFFLSTHHLALNIFPDLSQFVTYQTQNNNKISSDEPLQVLQPPTLPKKIKLSNKSNLIMLHTQIKLLDTNF
jgi:hypothetical protein